MLGHKYISILLITVFIVIPVITSAAGLNINSGLKKPIGGKILKSGQNAGIACSTITGPIFMNPFNIATPGPFFTRGTTNGIPKSGKYLLGSYKLVPDLGTCYNPETGAPIPAFELKPYGVSR